MPLESSLRDIYTLYKGVEKVLTSLCICRHAFAFHARKCIKYKYRNPCTGPRTHVFFVFFSVDEGREDLSTTISGPSSACQQSAIKLRFAGVPMIAQH